MFGECASLVRSGVNPKECQNERYVGLEHIAQGSLHLTGYGLGKNVDSQKSIFKKGDILFGKLRPYFRKLVAAPFDGICSTDIWVISPQKGIDRDFLFYWMASDNFISHATDTSEGTRMPRAKWNIVSMLTTPYFSLREQEQIGGTLGSLDTEIALNSQINATLEAIAQALFKSWFIDFDPVRAKIEDRQPEAMDETTAALFPAELIESEIGLIPKGWSPGALTEFATLNPESWSAKNHPSTVRYIDLANAKENRIEQIVDYDFSTAPSRARRVLRHGDSIIGTVRPGNRSFAYIQTNETNLTGSTGFAVLRPKHPSFSEFVYLAATHEDNIARLANLADGGAYPAVRPEVVLQTPVVYPNESILSAFSELVCPLFKQIQANQLCENQLVEMRDTLLPKLYSGQLRIPGIEPN